MKNKISSFIVFLLTAILFFALVVVNNLSLNSVRLDLTENKVYSLSDGSKQILQSLDEPLHLYFFFSDKSSSGMTQLRNYANRVQSLLEEYQSASEGKILLHVIDPEPFSEQEDQAAEFNLTAATVGSLGDSLYLGLAARNSLDDEEITSFFDPSQEQFLEYEISKLIYKLSDPKKVKVTVLTDLPIEGGQNPLTGQFDPAWTFYTQLQQLYDVENISASALELPDDTDVLMIIHPNELSEPLNYAIDQYVMQGKKLVAYLDAHNESDPLAAASGFGQANSSNMQKLLAAWGIEFDSDNVVLDAEVGLEVRTQDGGVARHLGFVGWQQAQFDNEDIVLANLETINGASFGYFSKTENSELKWDPLITSTNNSGLIDNALYAASTDPLALRNQFVNGSERKVVAVRVSGRANSAFDSKLSDESDSEYIARTNQLNAVFVGDTDILTDRFWVSQSNFFGQTIYTPFANNGDFITNIVENLGGSSELIGVRSRGTFARPFIVVDELTFIAEQKFREQEQVLQRQLEETDAQLAQLQAQQGEAGALVISEEQQQALDNFVEKRSEIRKALRDVQHQLDTDIEKLGSWIKFINIAAAPIILVLLLALIVSIVKRAARYKVLDEA
ncbi:ABC transporter [Alteromonadaceae bacterium M269]|nr:ABC transporter [Alteromonadaceae bacterium M269]